MHFVRWTCFFIFYTNKSNEELRDPGRDWADPILQKNRFQFRSLYSFKKPDTRNYLDGLQENSSWLIKRTFEYQYIFSSETSALIIKLPNSIFPNNGPKVFNNLWNINEKLSESKLHNLKVVHFTINFILKKREKESPRKKKSKWW